LRERKDQIKYLAVASLAYGLAIGSRPTLVFGAILLWVPVARAWFGPGGSSMKQIALLVVAAVAPVTLVVSGLLLYNYVRFDNPFEFGWHYQLTNFQNHGARQFSWSYVWYNFRFYFFQPMHWTGQYPFVNPVEIIPRPARYYGTGAGYGGILTDYPIVWLALAAPLAWRGKPAGETSDLRWFALAILLLFLTSATTLCFFFASGSGYESDFLPALMVLAGIGIFGVEQVLAGSPVWRIAARCGWSLLLFFSLVVTALSSIEAHAVTRYFNGDFLLSEGRPVEAAAQFRGALAIWPEYAGAWCGLGSVLLKQGQIDEAIVNYQKAIEFDPSLPEAVNNLGYCYFQKGQIDDAVVQYQNVLKIQPDYAQARNNLANCYLRLNRTDDAIVQYQKAVELDPGSATYQCGLGNAFLQKGRLADAIAQYQKALEIKPDFAAAHNYLAYCLFRQGQMADAISQYRQAIELDPKSAVFHSDLANALLQKGDADASIAEYQKALALQPKSADTCKRLGDAFFQKGELNDAIAQYQKALELDPDLPEALNNLGYCFLQSGRVDDAITLFEKLAKLKPDFAPAYNSLGDAWRRKGMASQAVTAFERAIELQPHFISAEKNLAWVLATWPDASIRNGTRAETLATEANQLSGGRDPEVLRTLAAAYAETGHFAEALATAQKALGLAQSDKDLTDKLKAEIRLYQNHAPCRDN
jgi:tetratricopeptide (TPR) repeat protein